MILPSPNNIEQAIEEFVQRCLASGTAMSEFTEILNALAFDPRWTTESIAVVRRRAMKDIGAALSSLRGEWRSDG